MAEVETTTEATPEPVKAPKPGKAQADSYLVQEGDTYPVLGDRLKPAGMTGYEFAVQLLDLNGGKTLVEGDEIKVK